MLVKQSVHTNRDSTFRKVLLTTKILKSVENVFTTEWHNGSLGMPWNPHCLVGNSEKNCPYLLRHANLTFFWLAGACEDFRRTSQASRQDIWNTQKWHPMCCLGFPMVGDGHQPNSRSLSTHYKASLLKVGWPSPISGVSTLAHNMTSSHPWCALIESWDLLCRFRFASIHPPKTDMTLENHQFW